jgi:arylsulfatase A-like enzyme
MAALACALTAFSCGKQDEPPENVVLVVVDTLHAGRTSLYGYERETTPRISEWAQGGAVFERAQAASSWTVPSMAMLLTGRYRVGGGRSLMRDGQTLCKALSAQGYRTVGIVANPVLNDLQGFDAGYESYDLIQGKDDDTDPLHIGSWTTGVVVEKALRWLREERDERPFFLYLHLMDPHFPYEPDDLEAFDWRDGETPLRRNQYDALLRGAARGPITDEELSAVEKFQAAYDGEVLQVDRGLGPLFDYLEESGLMERSLVVLTSDHGEGLWQRPSNDGWVNTGSAEGQLLSELYRGHGEQLYDELLWVPLVIRGPGVPVGSRDPRPVSLIDVYPTIFSLLDLSPPEGLHGAPLFGPTPAAGREDLFAICSRGTAITEAGRWKLHQPSGHISERGARPLLYDLESDPLERSPISDDALEARLKAKLATWATLNRVEAEELPLEDQRRLLLQMGYVGLAEDLDEEMSRQEIQRAMRAEREQRKAEEAAGD